MAQTDKQAITNVAAYHNKVDGLIHLHSDPCNLTKNLAEKKVAYIGNF